MLIDILIFILVLGVLIFVHELGHFLAAKACNIYVDRFSLGMPPRAFGVKIGETDYCIGALPLGGYVKMAGQEDAPLSDEERETTYGHVPEHRWFNKKPVWQRCIVIVAGPLMNFVLAIVLYGIVAAVGAEVPVSQVDSRVGFIAEDSPASKAPLYAMAEDGTFDAQGDSVAQGWQTGDRIVSIDGEAVHNITDVAISAILGGGEPMTVVIERPQPDGGVERFVSIATPQKKEEKEHPRFGVAPFQPALVDSVMPDSPAEEAGFESGDVLARADGKIIDSATFTDMVETWPESEPLTVEVQRDSQTLSRSLTPATIGRVQDVFIGSPLDPEEHETDQEKPKVLAVAEEMSDTFKSGDIIEKINGESATVAMYRELERDNPGGTMQLDVHRPARLFGFRKAKDFSVDVPIAPVRAIGVQFGVQMVFHKYPADRVIPEAFRQGYQAFERTLETLWVLIKGDVSPKDLGGPVMIYQITTTAASEGWWWLFTITAFVSANLCVFNLLPLPVLDGGLLLLLIIEAVRKKPVSLKVQERVQQVGMIFLIGLLLYVTYNDILRWIQTQLG